jgi:hypothetical protein
MKGGAMKKEIAKQIYAYCVCAVAMLVGIIFIVNGIYGIVKIAAPELTISQYSWSNIATFQSFKTEWEKNKESLQLTDEELKVRWEDKRAVALMGEKREGTQNLVNMLIAVVIVAPVFFVHWRLARGRKEEE